jgi:hypothetical protein
MNIILTQIGEKKSPHLIQCIKQLLFFGNDKIILISNKFHENLLKNHKLLEKIIFIDENKVIKNKEHIIFLKNTKLDKKFYSEFWIKTTERFFFIENICTSKKLKNIIHIESDNLIYENLNKFAISLKKFKILFNIANHHWCVPNIIYFKSYKEIKLLANFIYNKNKFFFLKNNLNDQELCIQYFEKYKSSQITNFPIISKDINVKNEYKKDNFFHKNFKKFNGIFDPAPIGQFLDGVDNNIHEIRGSYLNKNSIYDVEKLHIKFIRTKKIKKPYIILENKKKIPILNLHVHSKNLRNFISY